MAAPLPLEFLMGRIRLAYSMGLQSGPAQLDFTNLRVVGRWVEPPDVFPRPSRYRDWRARVGAERVLESLEQEYVPGSDPAFFDLPYLTVGRVHVGREVGILVDRTVTSLQIRNTREGWQFGAPTPDHPGVLVDSPGARPGWFFRVPAEPESVAGFLRRFPLAGAVDGP